MIYVEREREREDNNGECCESFDLETGKSSPLTNLQAGPILPCVEDH